MARPYRSHKIPACEACRRRKVRCAQIVEGAPCERCRKFNRVCENAASAPTPITARGSGITYAEADLSTDTPSLTSAEHPNAPSNSTSTPDLRTLRASSAVLLVGAELSEDVDVLQNYLSTRQTATANGPMPYHTVYSTPQESVVYVSVPRGRAGLEPPHPGKAQLKALQHLLGPSHHEELLALFAKHIHPYFPIVDLSVFKSLEHGVETRFPSTLLCYIYVASLRLWKESPILAQRPVPDMALASNLAVAALQDDFMTPTVLTINAAILDLLGRPVKTLTTNILTAARLVALAHSHGLHRDPTRWSSSPEPMSMRKRLWWAVLINDHWASYAHGTPPNILSDRHDVPMIEPTDYADVDSEVDDRHLAGSFTQLCMLTKILGELLSMVHKLHTDWTGNIKALRRIECDLDDWETQICNLYGFRLVRHPPTGHCSLWMSYLSVKLLVQRLYLRASASQVVLSVEDEKRYRMISVRDSAITIVDFIASLTRENFQEFWLSYSTHVLVSTTIMLLRCTIETQEEEVRERCKAKLSTLRTTLEKASSEYGWDIADMCLERCSVAIDRITHATDLGEDINAMQAHTSGRYTQNQPLEPEMFDPMWFDQSFPTLDLHLPSNSLDFSW